MNSAPAAQQPGRGGDAGDDEVALVAVVEGGEGAAGLGRQGLVRRQPGAVPAVQDAGACVLGVRDEELAAGRERVPVVGPPGGNALELGELLAIPLVDDRVPILALARCGVPGREDHPLGEPEEVPAADLPVPPLLGRERRHLLEGGEAVVAPLEDRRRGGELVGPGTGPDARHREERSVADREELRVLAARGRQRRPRCQAAAGPVKQQQAGVAVTAVHPRRSPGDIDGELRDGDKIMAGHPDALDGPRTRGGNPLDLGESDWHPFTTATAIGSGK